MSKFTKNREARGHPSSSINWSWPIINWAWRALFLCSHIVHHVTDAKPVDKQSSVWGHAERGMWKRSAGELLRRDWIQRIFCPHNGLCIWKSPVTKMAVITKQHLERRVLTWGPLCVWTFIKGKNYQQKRPGGRHQRNGRSQDGCGVRESSRKTANCEITKLVLYESENAQKAAPQFSLWQLLEKYKQDTDAEVPLTRSGCLCRHIDKKRTQSHVSLDSKYVKGKYVSRDEVRMETRLRSLTSLSEATSKPCKWDRDNFRAAL